MTDDAYDAFDIFEDEPAEEEISTDALANELAALKAQVASLHQSRIARDEIAAASLMHMQQPQPVWTNEPEIVASTPTPRVPPPRPRITEDQASRVTQEALTVAAATVPEWSTVAPQVVARVQENPSRLGELVRDAGTMGVANYLANLAQSERSHRDSRAMKLAAQTAWGAGGRIPTAEGFEQTWNEILNADTGKLGI